VKQQHFTPLSKRWLINPCDDHLVRQLQEQLGVSVNVCRLLVNRGIHTYEDARKFFRPALTDLHDPFLMKNMQQAVERITLAISRNEKILVYGDYDVDGTTAVALVYMFLKEFYPHLDYYIPNRYTEGYGISITGIDFAAANDFKLVIALDCGIKSVNEIAYARSKGIDFIICDHHLAGDVVPEAVAVLDPKQPGCDYPFKELSGCGVGFKLIEAYCQFHGIPHERACANLDLVAVSIASDIVPITGENRVLAYHGLQKFNTNPCSGLKALKEVVAHQKPYSISELVFIIGPRINAAGRIDDAKHAVRMLVAEASHLALDNAGILDDHNITRKKLDSDITREALDILNTSELLRNRSSTVLFQPHWHKGVIGIVASRLIDHFYRPTILLTESNGMAVGSARSVQGFDIHEAIQHCAPLLEKFGGHKYAAGLSLKLENLEPFAQRFEEVVSSTIPESLRVPEMAIDLELDLHEITTSLYQLLQQFEPFGPGNAKPVFSTSRVFDTGYSKIVGENHLKLSLRKNGSKANGIAFRGAVHYDMLKRKPNEPIRTFDICYTIEENEWNGITSLQLNVKDIKMNPAHEHDTAHRAIGETLPATGSGEPGFGGGEAR
jgi:single-stranded-DNA-specific exonuclease